MGIIEYGWRTESVAIARGGFRAVVEKFWCNTSDGESAGWRWSAWRVGPNGAVAEPSALISDTMAFSEAKAAAEAWLAEQIKSAEDFTVYAFAGAETTAARSDR